MIRIFHASATAMGLHGSVHCHSKLPWALMGAPWHTAMSMQWQLPWHRHRMPHRCIAIGFYCTAMRRRGWSTEHIHSFHQLSWTFMAIQLP